MKKIFSAMAGALPGRNIFGLAGEVKFATRMLASVGLDLDAVMASGDSNALRDHLAAIKAGDPQALAALNSARTPGSPRVKARPRPSAEDIARPLASYIEATRDQAAHLHSDPEGFCRRLDALIASSFSTAGLCAGLARLQRELSNEGETRIAAREAEIAAKLEAQKQWCAEVRAGLKKFGIKWGSEDVTHCPTDFAAQLRAGIERRAYEKLGAHGIGGALDGLLYHPPQAVSYPSSAPVGGAKSRFDE